MEWQPIESLTPEYGQKVILRGLGYQNEITYAVVEWVKNGERFHGPHGGLHYRDAWNLLEVGGYAADSNVCFTPTHWCELPPEPIEKAA